MNELELRQEAAHITSETLSRAAVSSAKKASCVRPVCLIERSASPDDVPIGTVMIPMSQEVARHLHSLGLQEPVSLTHLQDRWWLAQVDAAHFHPMLEFGGAYRTVAASTADLLFRYTAGYVRAVQGPFTSEAEALALL